MFHVFGIPFVMLYWLGVNRFSILIFLVDFIIYSDLIQYILKYFDCHCVEHAILNFLSISQGSRWSVTWTLEVTTPGHNWTKKTLISASAKLSSRQSNRSVVRSGSCHWATMRRATTSRVATRRSNRWKRSCAIGGGRDGWRNNGKTCLHSAMSATTTRQGNRPRGNLPVLKHLRRWAHR